MTYLNFDEDKLDAMPVFYFINFINVIHDNYLKENFKGIAPRDFTYLSNIYYHKDISQKELADLLHVSESNVTQIIKRLEKNGYVKRDVIKGDNCKKILNLTQEGKSVFSSLLNIVIDFESQLFRDYTAEDNEKFKDMLHHYCQNAAEFD